MTTSTDSTGRVREHFRRKAFSFDHLYDEEHALQRLLRPGLFNRRALALEVAHEYDAPSVLDVGGGSGRIGEFLQGDFLATPLDGPFDVVLALGYFDYIEDAGAHTRRIGDLCSGSAIASFPRWSWTKGPIRKLRYEVINNCPIFDYDREGLRDLFSEAGFHTITIRQGRSGFLVRADR